MFSLKTASQNLRKVAASHGIKSGKYEPLDAGRPISAMADNEVVARVYNRNHPEGIEITAGDMKYIEEYA